MWQMVVAIVSAYSAAVCLAFAVSYMQAMAKHNAAKRNGWGQFIDWKEVVIALSRGEGTLIVTRGSSRKTYTWHTKHISKDELDDVYGVAAMDGSSYYVTLPPVWHYCSDHFLRQSFRFGAVLFHRIDSFS